ncbi:MAG: hypothetical protein DBX52_02825 [Clostridiales bacterium]|nr:MAG: hypothetical protein DBX52_02825 [Clostridiales bacterium]
MKIKPGFISVFLIGLIAGILRVAQYILAIDEEGYYLKGGLPRFLEGFLVGLLLVGLAWAVFCGIARKSVQVGFSSLGLEALYPRILFALLGLTAAAQGILCLTGSVKPTSVLVGLFCLLGAIGWFLPARLGRATGLTALLPLLHLGAAVIAYFWDTYKYIHISEYALGLLGLCVLLFFALNLMKIVAGGEVPQHRLARAGFYTLLFSFASFLAPAAGMMLHGWKAETLLLCLTGLLYILLAVYTLRRLPAAVVFPRAEGPDVSEMNDYISDIPEIKENDEND